GENAVALRTWLLEQRSDLGRVRRAVDERVAEVDARDALLRTRRHAEVARDAALREDLDHAVDRLGAVHRRGRRALHDLDPLDLIQRDLLETRVRTRTRVRHRRMREHVLTRAVARRR